MIRPFVASALLLTLAACNTAAPPPPAPAPTPGSYAGLAPGVSPPGFRLPEGADCTAAVARWKAIQDNDLATGHVGQSVYNQIRGDIDRASAACAAGKDAEAQAIVRASRARHGYPAG